MDKETADRLLLMQRQLLHQNYVISRRIDAALTPKERPPRQTRRDKEYGNPVDLIDDINGAYTKFLKLPASSRSEKFALNHYLQRELALPDWKLRRRLSELKDRYGLTLGMLPWTIPPELVA